MALTRRGFLRGAVVWSIALGSGCVDSSGVGSNNPSGMPKAETSTTAEPTLETATTASVPTSTSEGIPSTSPVDEVPVREPLACDGSLQRLSYPTIDELRYGAFSGFNLTISEKPVALGEMVTFRLENTSDTTQTTGNKQKFDIQRHTDNGWQSIYWAPENYAYTAVGILHRPGEGFTWRFPFTPDGLEQSTQFNTPYSVCGPLPPGEYQFVYWGVFPERHSNPQTEYAIGVRFTVVQP